METDEFESSLYCVVLRLFGEDKVLYAENISFDDLFGYFVDPYNESKNFWVDGVTVTPTKIKAIKIYRQSEGFGNEVSSFYDSVSRYKFESQEDGLLQIIQNVQIEILCRKHSTDVTYIFLDPRDPYGLSPDTRFSETLLVGSWCYTAREKSSNGEIDPSGNMHQGVALVKLIEGKLILSGGRLSKTRESLLRMGTWSSYWAEICSDGRLRFAYKIDLGEFKQVGAIAQLEIEKEGLRMTGDLFFAQPMLLNARIIFKKVSGDFIFPSPGSALGDVLSSIICKLINEE